MKKNLSMYWVGCLSAATIIAVQPVASGAAANRQWPQWRGPLGNGLVPEGNPPTEWSESKNVKWKVAVPGKGHATPIIWGDKIFVLTAVSPAAPRQGQLRGAPLGSVFGQAQPPAQNPERRPGGRRGPGGPGREAPTEPVAFTVLCLDRRTGKVLWEKVPRKEVPHQGVQESNTYASGSPVTDGELLYVSFGSQGLYCLDLDGKLVWEKDLGKVSVIFGEGASPALAGNTLLVVQDNDKESFIYAFEKKSGRELWKKKREERSGWTTPYILKHGGKTLALVSGASAVRAYDLESGDVVWQCAGLGSNPVPMLVADKEAVYAMSGHRNPAAMAIKLGGSGNLTGTPFVLWTTDRGTPYVPSPLLMDGLLFYCQKNSGVMTCVDAISGKPHYEQQRLEGISGVYGSPIGVGDRIYLPGQNGTVVILAKSKELKILASNKLDDGFDASPAVGGDELFLRGRSSLYCIAAQ